MTFALHHLRLLLLLLALGLGGLLIWRAIPAKPSAVAALVSPAPSSRVVAVPATPSPERPVEGVEARRHAILATLADAPAYAPFVELASQIYPADWERIVDGFARRAVAANALDKPETYVSDALGALRRDRGVLAGAAGADALTHVFDAQAALLQGLAGVDKRLCVDFLLGQTSPAFTDFVSSHRALLADLAVASVGAMADGARAHVERDPPTSADFDALEHALAGKGLEQPLIDALLDGRLPDPAPPDDALCNAGLVYFDALKSLPEDARLRLYALAARAMSKS